MAEPASDKISWIIKWPHQDYTGFSTTQIKNARGIYKKLAVVLIEAQIGKLKKKGTIIKKYTLTWTKERSGPKHFLLCYLNPPVILKGRPGTGGGAKISPQPPPKP
jgi:hypothetical protein